MKLILNDITPIPSQEFLISRNLLCKKHLSFFLQSSAALSFLNTTLDVVALLHCTIVSLGRVSS